MDLVIINSKKEAVLIGAGMTRNNRKESLRIMAELSRSNMMEMA